jgi:hypothetical protein
MFEEIAVWTQISSNKATRYLGFRNLETDRVWIAFGNFISDLDEDDASKDLQANELICADSTLEAFLKKLPADDEAWKPTIVEALAYFRANNPDGS